MKLIDLTATLETLDDTCFIGARRPWREECEVALFPMTEDYRFPEEAIRAGYEYFLEVSTAQEICEVFERKPIAPERKASFILFYAENDAFPDWEYDA
ncbi:hypothetical protein IQ22_04755 [Pseudomonas duriflava]|uniref:DUF7716 domain-containing protein n=1 Tax=Pseudomonas duriflava TaxID=459528 RepID=A0A562PHL5_9PSED|nr:hypothetical protein [Pseudomonas duriflava]TWI43931.1 hypothetical protein IQ22_04755 [Pseudomonas duriflava]